MGAELDTDKELTDAKKPLSRASRMEKQLKARFAPISLTLSDDSGLHAGHGGARPEGETHYRLAMVSDAFEGLSRVARQRLVMEALTEEFASGLHALSLDLKTPQESR
jgi:BolA protein